MNKPVPASTAQPKKVFDVEIHASIVAKDMAEAARIARNWCPNADYIGRITEASHDPK